MTTLDRRTSVGYSVPPARVSGGPRVALGHTRSATRIVEAELELPAALTANSAELRLTIVRDLMFGCAASAMARTRDSLALATSLPSGASNYPRLPGH